MSKLDELVLATLAHVPRPVIWRMARRYVAGERLEDAVRTLLELRRRGHPGIIDVLGEDVLGEAQARGVADEYRRAADAVVAAQLDAYVSIKPTHLGLRTSERLCHELYRSLAIHCRERGLFVRVEMEDHTTTDATLRVFETLRAELPNVGIVLQSRLYRTPDDIAKLTPGPLHVRLVKGVYLEAANIAHTDAQAIRDAYIECARALLARGASVSFATHDGPMAERALELVRERRLARNQYELQVLLGVQEHLWRLWQSQGHTVRVYVPFGPEWLPYSLRRLRKNPEMLRHVMRATLGLSPR